MSDVITFDEIEKRKTKRIREYKMNSKDFEKLIRDFFEEHCIDLMIGKRKEYARDDEVFHNFKKAGRRRGKTPEEALMGMKEKQATSIDDLIQRLDNMAFIEGPKLKLTKVELNIFKEKIRDDINYLFLLWGLLNERFINE